MKSNLVKVQMVIWCHKSGEEKNLMASQDECPSIAIIGGFYNLDDAKKSEAVKIAESLGAALANAGFNLVVYLADENSLEPHVVRGYVPQALGRKRCIRIRTPQKLRAKATFDEESNSGDMFHPDIFPSENWEAPFYQSLADKDGVDAVVLLSGGGSTLIAGHIALARKLPVLAVEKMGGSAYEIWKQLKIANPSTSNWNNNGSEQLVTELRAKCDDDRRIRYEREKDIKNYDSWASTKRFSVLCATTLITFVAALVYALIGDPDPGKFVVATIIGLLAAGSTGALARGIISANARSNAAVTLLLGSIAGLVVGLGYIIPQLVGSAGIFDPKQTTVTATDVIQLLSALLISLSAGVGFDTVFNRLRTQAESLPISGESK
jgi:hypothetical protein